MTSPAGTVYMIHFDTPYAHARHYTGWAKDVDARLAEHAAGTGARLMEVIKGAGITWQLAATWTGTRSLERTIKNRGGASRTCPICSAQGLSGKGIRCTKRSATGPSAHEGEEGEPF